MEDQRLSNTTSVFEMDSVLVDYSLEGFVAANSGLVLLEGHKIVMRRDYRQLQQVKLLSGGWSGLEPLFTGFVGPGILTAAVVGEKFCAPPPRTILIAIRELAFNSIFGVLVIVMNHPDSKMNFMLAVECARREGITVELIFVADDCSGALTRQGRKGLAGIALVLKIAGAMADKNRSLEEICKVCGEVSTVEIATVSVDILKGKKEEHRNSYQQNTFSMTSGTGVYNNDKISLSNSSDSLVRAIHIQEDLIEKRSQDFGLHSYSSTSDLARILLGYLVDGSHSIYSILKDHKSPIAILINNYGFMMTLEINAFVRELLVELQHRKIVTKRLYVGTVIVSRTTGGFSLTAMTVNEDIIHCLDHPVSTAAWPTTVLFCGNPATPLPIYVKGYSQFEQHELKELGPILTMNVRKMIYRALDFACMALLSCEEQLNKMGGVSHDDLYGTQVKMTAQAMGEALYSNQLSIQCPFALFSQLSTICSDTLCNKGGCLYTIFFDGISQSFLRHLNQTTMTPTMWICALNEGIVAIEQYSGIRKGERNILDALYPMFEALKKSPFDFIAVAEAAELGSLNTVNRDSESCAVPDLSTHTLALWVRAVVEGLVTFRATKEINLQEITDDLWDDDVGSYSLLSLQ